MVAEVLVVAPAPDVVTEAVVGPMPLVVALPVVAPLLEAAVVVAAPLVEVAVAPPAPLEVDVLPEAVEVDSSPLDFDESASEQALAAKSAALPTDTLKMRLVIGP